MESPWLPPGFLEWFNELDTKDWVLFEWGSGYSTPWFANRVKKLYSIEHDSQWYKKVLNLVEGRKNVEVLRFDVGSPQYITCIDRFPDRHFDCILIDGRRRVDCVRRAIAKTKYMLILDNGLRSTYMEARNLLGDWSVKVFDFPGNPKESSTLVYTRPVA